MSIFRLVLPALLLASAARADSAAIPVRPVRDAGGLVAEVGKGRPVVLHFWATWCQACNEEFPRLRDTLNALPGENVSVLLVSIDRPQQAAAARAMLEKYGVASLPSIILDAPSPDPVAQAFEEPRWDGTLPATFVYAASGKKVKSFIGPVAPKALRKAVRRAKKLTAARQPPAPPKG